MSCWAGWTIRFQRGRINRLLYSKPRCFFPRSWTDVFGFCARPAWARSTRQLKYFPSNGCRFVPAECLTSGTHLQQDELSRAHGSAEPRDTVQQFKPSNRNGEKKHNKRGERKTNCNFYGVAFEIVTRTLLPFLKPPQAHVRSFNKNKCNTLNKAGTLQLIIAKQASCSQSAVFKHINGKCSKRGKFSSPRRTAALTGLSDKIHLGICGASQTEAGVRASRVTTHRQILDMGCKSQIPHVRTHPSQRKLQKQQEKRTRL